MYCKGRSCAKRIGFYLFRVILKNNLSIIAAIAAFVGGAQGISAGPIGAPRYNDLILQQIRTMPQGGRYSTSSYATGRLRAALSLESGRLLISPELASPSYCSGATYLVFVKTIETLRARGALALPPESLESLLVRGQRDGQGVWGRWNANGPGTARLFYQLNLGQNFDDFAEAQPGDFLKIFWSSEVGRAERGHSVIYLGTERKAGVDYVRFWSSNTPAGYGEKSVPRAKIVHAIFSRLDAPQNLDQAVAAAAMDKYLASLVATRSSYEEAKGKCGM